MTRYSDNYPANVESPQRIYTSYAADIHFDYSKGEYPSGDEEEWFWENQYIPIPHEIDGEFIDKHSFMRIKIGSRGSWTYPIRMAPEGPSIPIPINNGWILSQIDGNTIWVDPSDIAGANITASLPIEYDTNTSIISHSNLDGNRHIPTGGTSGEVLSTDGNGNYSWILAGNDYVDSIGFNTSDGIFTLGRTGSLGNLTQNLDGRYLTSFTEVDPVFTASPSFGITTLNITNWNTAFGWGDHSGLYSLLGHTHVEADITDLKDYLLDAPLDGSTYGRKNGAWEPVVSTDNYVTGGSFNILDGLLTLTRTGALGDVTFNLDGRYSLLGHNHDSVYYTKTQLQTSAQASVHWDNITNTPADAYVNSVTFNTGDGVLTLGRTASLGNLTQNFDGRYMRMQATNITSWDSYTSSVGELIWTNGATNPLGTTSMGGIYLPVGGHGTIIAGRFDDDAIHYSNHHLYFRHYENSNWQSWIEILHKDNINEYLDNYSLTTHTHTSFTNNITATSFKGTSIPTSSGGLSAGDFYTQTATQIGGTGTTKVLCIV